ncbi:hypothetical protein [Methylobacterium pseudosasicola]|uniref:Uncharacterized protein n=1 Tax=Methylobacterium pseudosasicola TaxID=582667 RepID=A0A1I4HJ72_9HYPH|nr:hypothetical protein [Methylobacterium pseudosasicola]SFL42358.1 hypothetical protein SAMN05192568_1004280 [Methylobacterium pseudosasicola]
MADTYDDLAALAAKDPAGKGRLWHVRDGNCWSYAGCPTPPDADLKVPNESVPDGRVRAALTDGTWMGAVIDVNATPIMILAVQKTPAPGAPVTVLRASDLGTPAAA